MKECILKTRSEHLKNNPRYIKRTTNQKAIKYSLTKKINNLLRWALIFFVVAIIAAVFGFGGVAAGAASIAKILFYIFLALLVIALIAGMTRRV